MTTESIIHKIQSLRAKASNAASTEAEVEAAAAAITKLMMKHDVTEQDLIDTGKASREAVHAKTNKHKRDLGVIINECWMGIEALTETKIWRTGVYRGKGDPEFHYVGDPADVEMALYLHEMLTIYGRRAFFQYCERLADEGRGKDTTARYDFYTTFGRRMQERMDALAQERQRARQGSTALVVRKDGIIKSKMESMGISLRKSRRKARALGSHDAASAGREAANSVNLNRPFAGANKTQLR